ncbi:MAG: tetratricopeptide repeat protein, partial [Acidobacteriota bacterium]
MSTLTLRPHHPSRRHILLLVAMVALSAPLAAQPPEAFDDEKRVTAIDLLVSFEAGAMREWAKDGPVPKTLRPEDFEVLYDGEPRPVVAVDATQGAWQTVIYFDTVLAGTTDLRWSATVLADEIEALTALGQVTVIVADPAPRTLLSASRDTDQLHSMLAQQAQTIEGVDEIQALRMEVVDELQREGSELDAEVLREIAAGEARRVRERQNDLLLTLAEHDTAGAHRALIFAGHRFDLRPEDFYEPLIAQLDGSSQVPGTPSGSGPSGSGTPSGASPQKVPGTPSEGLAEKVPGTVSEADFYESLIALRQHIAQDVPGTPPSTPGTLSSETLTASTETLARTLAAYGWVSLPLAPPAPKPLKPGKRIGKFRLSGPGIVYDEDENRTFFKFFSATFEENRKPLRAEAYLELGAALEGQGKLAEAEEALRQAIYYFSGDPRTADQQAEAYARLGKILASQGQSQASAAAQALARQLDPERFAQVEEIAETGPPAALLAPLQASRILGRTTQGGIVRSANRLRQLLDDLGRRVRLTYQVDGAPDGKLHTLEANFVG